MSPSPSSAAPHDVRLARAALKRLGATTPLIAKIEKPEALDDLAGVIEAADGVMVARGDLGVELSPERVPSAQKRIIRLANERGKVVITATQMLESMTTNPQPTRAEASDVFNAILDGTDAVMLSGETAIGAYPVETVRMMQRIAAQAEVALPDWRRRDGPGRHAHARAIAEAAVRLACDLRARALVVVTRSGYTARLVSSLRPPMPIIALTESATVYDSLALWWGLQPHRTHFHHTAEATIAAFERNVDRRGAYPGEGLARHRRLVGAHHGCAHEPHQAAHGRPHRREGAARCLVIYRSATGRCWSTSTTPARCAMSTSRMSARRTTPTGRLNRFGVWVANADGTNPRFAWLDDDGWQRPLRYRLETLVTNVRAQHDGLGICLHIEDVVDFNRNVYIKKVVTENLGKTDIIVRFFFHFDAHLWGNNVGDTGYYDPRTGGLVFYKGLRYFLLNARVGEQTGLRQWAVGEKEIHGKEGTWRDAEDGKLSKNPVAQGSIDGIGGTEIAVPAGKSRVMYWWLAAGESIGVVGNLDLRMRERDPETYLSRTHDYWNLWLRKEQRTFADLPDGARHCFNRSLLTIRTNIDNNGAIIAASDADILQFGRDTYTYMWPRDGALVATALIRAGYPDIARTVFRLHRTIDPARRLPAAQIQPGRLDGLDVAPVRRAGRHAATADPGG